MAHDVNGWSKVFGHLADDPDFVQFLTWTDTIRKCIGKCDLCRKGEAAFEPMVYMQHEFGLNDMVVQKKTIGFMCSLCGVEMRRFVLPALAQYAFPQISPGKIVTMIKKLSEFGQERAENGVSIICEDPNCPDHKKPAVGGDVH